MKPIEELLTQSDGLADRLQALRAASGMSGKQLAEALSWYASKVSRLENGRTRPSADDLHAWAQACGATFQQRQELLDLLGELHAAHRDWRRRMRTGHAAIQEDYHSRIAATSRMCNFETAFVPGMLQTPAYARCVAQEMQSLHELAPDPVDSVANARIRRQQFLYDDSKAFEFLLAEPVLLWPIYPPQVMRAQLDRIATAAVLPNVRLGVLPLDSPPAITPQNSFAIYDDVVIVETFTAETTCGAEESEQYRRIMDRLWERAATGEEALRLVTSAIVRLK